MLSHFCQASQSNSGTAVMGIGQGGADEDDFHTFKRKNSEVDTEEKVRLNARKAQLKAMVDPASKAKPAALKPKKVVYF